MPDVNEWMGVDIDGVWQSGGGGVFMIVARFTKAAPEGTFAHLAAGQRMTGPRFSIISYNIVRAVARAKN
ncbi:hypothetical protein [Roseimicrobium sp. ORNL1]|uniref:hypothetical protein n=1 Tax=Roseimicrobium sp. ORNL1 TaxID=2711231 RepID=UPI0013E1F884|nr:hypothetical protein [Roseimicrobium sp. ORNL1]QIF04436.1 hypothetical protein G5S37_23890 [Roseimicrobium sp. ORNL1]